MLGYISNAQVGMLPDSSLIGVKFSNQGLDHGRLASTIGSQDCNSAVQGALQGDVADHILGHARIPGHVQTVRIHTDSLMLAGQLLLGSEKKGLVNAGLLGDGQLLLITEL